MRTNIITIFFIIAICVFCFSNCKTERRISNSLSLYDSTWELTTIQHQPIDSLKVSEKPFIVFQREGTFYGNFSCNNFFGSFYTKKQKLQLEYAGATKQLCMNMDLEKAFLKSLKSDISNYTISDSILTLYAGKEEIMQFKYIGSTNMEN